MKPLRDVKSTNYFWLGEIPSTWKLPKTAWHFKIGMGETILGESLVEKGIPVYSATEKDHFFGYVSKANLHLEKGDLVVPARGNSIGHVKIVSQLSTTTQTTIYLKRISDVLESKFVYWFMKGFKGDLFPFVQTAIPQLTVDEVSKNPIVQPPLYEQRQITVYLNRETAKIDRLIAKQQKLIKLLQEKRQAVISQTVTKGLDPKVKMKDSGVEWLGAVPEHWKVGLSKRFLGTLSGFAFPSAGFSADEADPKLLRGINVGVSQLRWNDVVYWKRSRGDKLDDFELEAGDIVLGMDRPLIGKGLRIASVTNADLPCLLLQRVLKFNFGKDLLSGYFKLLMEGGFFAAFIEPDMTGVSVPHISPTQVENFKIPVPPIQEQLSILEFITRKVAMFSNLIDKSENSIKLLYEHRQALITAAVTGKIDVRDLVTAEEVAALDSDPVLETTEEDFESEVAEADYITEEE